MFDIEELFSKRNQKFAFEALESKPMSRDIDNMPISDLRGYWEINCDNLIKRIKDKTYRFGIIKLKDF